MSIRNRLFNYDKWLVILLTTMPIILMAFDNWNVRTSISNYVYMKHNQVFYFLLIIAASMFGYSGAIWLKNYNILLGVALAGVALTPHLEYPIIHYVFAIGFFLGSVFVMIYYSSKQQRKFKIIAGILIVIAMLLHFVFKIYSLFWAEWIGIIPIAIHYLGESLNIID